MQAARDNCSAGGFGMIVAALDCMPGAEVVIETARKLAKMVGARIRLVHANDLGANVSAPAAECDEMLREHCACAHATLARKVAELRDDGIDVEAVAIEGIPSDVILKEANNADLLVMGKHWRPRWRLFSRNTVEAVLAAAPCPVVIAGGNPKRNHTGQGAVGNDKQTIRN
ncbi:MAG: universal stress protein [Limisphaerales bacterium]